MRDANRLKSIMAGLGELYGKECTKALMDLYWSALSDYTDEAVDSAVKSGIRKWKCFGRLPSPAEIIEEIGGGGDERAMVAWEKLQEAVRRAGAYASPEFDDPKIVRVVQALGGWQEVCLWPVSEMHFRRQEFCKAYISMGDGGAETRLIGIHEQQNAALNYDLPVERVRIAGRADRAKLRGNIGSIAGTLIESMQSEAN